MASTVAATNFPESDSPSAAASSTGTVASATRTGTHAGSQFHDPPRHAHARSHELADRAYLQAAPAGAQAPPISGRTVGQIGGVGPPDSPDVQPPKPRTVASTTTPVRDMDQHVAPASEP